MICDYNIPGVPEDTEAGLEVDWDITADNITRQDLCHRVMNIDE